MSEINLNKLNAEVILFIFCLSEARRCTVTDPCKWCNGCGRGRLVALASIVYSSATPIIRRNFTLKEYKN